MKIGYFGGTFDPPHLGHQILAMEALYQLELDQVQWILTPNPPHKKKQGISSVENRIELLQAAFVKYPKFTLSRIDLDRNPPHYAADTVKLLKEQDSSSSLIYIIGEDSLRDLPNWHAPSRFLECIDQLCVARRPNVSVDLSQLDRALPGIKLKVVFLENFRLEISSSIIRERIISNSPYQHLVAPGVYNYINENHIY